MFILQDEMKYKGVQEHAGELRRVLWRFEILVCLGMKIDAWMTSNNMLKISERLMLNTQFLS